MNANFFRYDFVNNTIIGSKSAIKRAGNPATAEYRELVAMKAKYPTFAIVEKDIKKNESKKTYNGLTLTVMKNFIESQNDSKEKLAEFEKVQKHGYPLTKKWFLDNYKDKFTMTDVKKTASKVRVARIAKANA